MPDPTDPPDPPKLRNGSWPAWLIAYAATLFVIRDVVLTLFK